MDLPLLEAAIALGLPVFPCDRDKRPLIRQGFKAASIEPRRIRRAFLHIEAVLIGVPTGAVSGLVVVDVDVRDGKKGLAWFEQHHLAGSTRTHRTMSGGLHLVYALPVGVEVRNSAGKLAPGVDVRGDGGYVIHPPSPGYAVTHDVAPAPLPDWILAKLKPVAGEDLARPARQGWPNTPDFARRALLHAVDRMATASSGFRNDTLNSQAFHLGTYVGAGLLSLDEVAGELAYAARLAGLQEREITATLNSGLRAGMARPRERD